MSSEKSESSFLPKSNTFKNILNKPKEEPKSFGKEEFLARRKFFLQKLESEGGIPKPKSLISNSATRNKNSKERTKTTFIKPIYTTSNVSSNLKRTDGEKEMFSLPDHEWSVSSAKSESLRKIIDMAGKQETNTVGKSVFSARQKFFADSQLSSVDQLMPRPSTPPGYSYIDRCPSPSLEPRRHSYSLYTSSSPSFGSSSISSSNQTPIVAPSPKPASFSLPWEQSNNTKKDIIQPKPQQSVNIIESLEKTPLVSEEIVKLPDPVNFTKETLSMDETASVKIEKMEMIKPMVAKIIESLPDPVIFTKEQLPNDEPNELTVYRVEIPEMYTPKTIYIMPEPVSATKEILPQDELLNIDIETIVCSKPQTPEIITIMPEPVVISSELLPQDQPLEIETININAEKMNIPEKIHISEKYNEIDNELKTNIVKTMDISSLTLESNIEEKKGKVKNNDYYSSEVQPLIDNNRDTYESENDSIDENQPLLDNDNKNLTKKSSIGSISEVLNSNGTLSLDEPLPRKSIPEYQSDETINDLIDLSDSDNLSDEVKNWYSVVNNAITNNENNN